jgi:hypothetical protein
MRRAAAVVTLLVLVTSMPSLAGEPASIRFKKTRLDGNFRSEGVAVGDFNRDGKLDIAAGYVWYAAPDWQMHSIVQEPPVYDPKGYANSFVNAAMDVNHDGWTDLIVVDFPGTPTWWFENPGPAGQDRPWRRHQCTPVSNNESPHIVDLTGDGRLELVMGFSPDPEKFDGPDRRMGFMTPASDPMAAWAIHAISAKAAPGTQRYSHGMGVGDVNGDGRQDVLVTEGWWEAPAQSSGEAWQFHAADFGEPCAQMHAYDFDGDGDNDVLTSSAHNFGIWWHEQVGPNRWTTHLIDDSFSQTHGLCLADINGDGLMDFVTGKRWWAHGGKDPGGDQPAVFFWFELQREQGRPRWIAHQFDHDSGPGTQFEVVDVNGDGLLDVAASNKKGVHYFQQQRD